MMDTGESKTRCDLRDCEKISPNAGNQPFSGFPQSFGWCTINAICCSRQCGMVLGADCSQASHSRKLINAHLRRTPTNWIVFVTQTAPVKAALRPLFLAESLEEVSRHRKRQFFQRVCTVLKIKKSLTGASYGKILYVAPYTVRIDSLDKMAINHGGGRTGPIAYLSFSRQSGRTVVDQTSKNGT